MSDGEGQAAAEARQAAKTRLLKSLEAAAKMLDGGLWGIKPAVLKQALVDLIGWMRLQ